MRYLEIIEETQAESLQYFSRVKKELSGRSDIIWHQTGVNSAKLIMDQGFKTGCELGRGETCAAIFFTGVFHRDVVYNRDGHRTRSVYLPALITDLNLITSTELGNMMELSDSNRKMVDQGHWTEEYARAYQGIQNMDDGLFPDGVDGAYKDRGDGKRGAYALTKSAANRALRQALALAD